MEKVVETKVGDFFTQKLRVGNVTEHTWEYCKKLSEGKKVLHVGCSDHPIFDPGTSLHLQLVDVAKDLHGMDPNGIDAIREHYDGTYFRSLETADRDYDTILVPNVIEHLRNPGKMIDLLFFSKYFKQLFVLVPNYSISEQATYENGIFTEKVHPDHYSFYSPYTLYNLLKSNIDTFDCEVELNFFDNGSMIGILITRNG